MIKDDPYQLHNLSQDPKHRASMEKLAGVLFIEMKDSRDTGLVPEGMAHRLSEGGTIAEVVRGEDYKVERVLDAAWAATSGKASKVEALKLACEDPDGIIRYWAATGALVLGNEAAPMKAHLLKMLEDPVPDVRVVAAEALGYIGETEKNLGVLVEVLKTGNEHEALAAITALKALGRNGILPMEKVKELIPKKVPGDCNRLVEALEKIE